MMVKRDFISFITAAANVKPSKRQLEWFSTEFYAFVHFSPNTYTNLEWGLGNENPAIFNPTQFDPDQWVEAVKSAGMRGIVITAKHHDGFCLWQSKFTEHCMKNSPYKNGKGDIVGELAEACRRGGIKFGFYLSPWDRNSKYYGTDEYNTYYKNQLTELLTNYGEVFHVWFDGACGEGPNGKKQVYDFEGYIDLIRKYQPDATIFNDHGPDVRWCGNESGSSRVSEWAVVPSELTSFAEKQTRGALMGGGLDFMYNGDSDIGALSNIIYSKGLCFCGSEVDMSIRPGWFYHPDQEPHSLERLFDTYVDTVGGNCCFNLNIPPMPSGRFDERDVARLKELGDKIRNTFGKNLAVGAITVKSAYCDSVTQCKYNVILKDEAEPKYIVLAEDISQGQRVESFCILVKNTENGSDETIFSGTCIGNKKICRINGQKRFSEFTVQIRSARGEVILKSIEVY